MFLFVTTLIFMFISKLRFPKKVSIVTILKDSFIKGRIGFWNFQKIKKYVWYLLKNGMKIIIAVLSFKFLSEMIFFK